MDGFLLACVQGSAMALLVLVVRVLSGRWVRRYYIRILWLLVLLRLSLPLSCLVPSADMRVMVDAGAAVESSAGQDVSPTGVLSAAVVRGVNQLASIHVPWAGIWAIGFCACSFILISLLGIQRSRIGNAMPVAFSGAVKRWVSSHKLYRPLSLKELSGLKTPIAYGVARPRIVVPRGYLNSQIDWTMALEHEYVHVRRFDSLFRTLFLIVCCFYWFNPIVWIAFRAFQRDQELACDEAVVDRFGFDSRERYAHALLDAAAASLTALMPFPAFKSSGSLSERIKFLINPASLGGGPCAVISACVVMVMLLTAVAVSPLALSLQPYQLKVDECRVALPDSWVNRVEVMCTDASATVSVKGYPELKLLELIRTNTYVPDTSDGRAGNQTYRCLWSGESSDGTTYELWGLCYAGMSLENAWHDAPYSAPAYPGEVIEREAIELSTGGAVTVEAAKAANSVDDAWFDFYCGEIVPTARLD